MKKKAMQTTIAALALALLLTTALGGCGGKNSAAETAAPVESPEAERQDGERFETVTDSHAQSGPAGTWQTASIGFEPDGSMAPEYHVQFTDTEIVYGHVRDGEFVFDHADQIVSLEKTAAGFRIQAEAANGVRYIYQSCESDDTVLEYFETWNEDEFPEMYRGGASLSRSD